MAEFEEDIPGAEILNPGLQDLWRGQLTNEALLLAIGAPRLRRLGVQLPSDDSLPGCPEHKLYERLEVEDAHEAHSRYNALLRRLISFERALEQRKHNPIKG